MPQPVRETQRVPRSCIPCSRRKVKCSKKIPCEQCIQRGDTATCMREVVKVGGKVTVAVDVEEHDGHLSSSSILLRENISLKIRIKQLELALARPELLKLETDIPKPTPGAQDLHSSETILSDFQSQAFGISIESTESPARHMPPWDNQVKLILPTRKWSDLIVEFSLVQLGWVHCALDETTFIKEHKLFWKSLIDNEKEALINHGWIAVYFSVLAVGAYFLDEKTIDNVELLYESFSTSQTSPTSSLGKDPTSLCRTWYAAALRELYLADYTRKQSLPTVQALAILNIVHKNLGEPSREYILHGVAVNVARLVGIDHLGEDNTGNAIITGSSQAQRNVHRRLWWTLVICDWLTIWSRPISIHPTSFTTVLETKDEKSETPSKFEYHKVMAQVAAMTRNHINSIRDWSTETVQAALKEVDSVCAAFPPHLSYPRLPEESVHGVGNEPYWCSIQRHLILNCVDSWRITLCVAMIPQILERREPERDGRSAVLQEGNLTAKRMLQRRCNDPSPHFHKFWSVTCATVTAGIFLALNLICFQNYLSAAEVTELKQLVTLSVSLIEQSSTEARHGALLVLRRLAHLYEHVLFLTPVHRIDRAALARIVRLVAYPSLWDSLPDTEATVRFIFLGSQCSSDWLGNSPCSSKSSSELKTTSGDGCEVEHGEVLGAWDNYSTVGGQIETVPYFDQLFPSAELIDMSFPLNDSAMLDDMLG